MKIFYFVALMLVMCSVSLGDGRYVNAEYGFDIQCDGDWYFDKTPKLHIDLHALNDEQLQELLGAYGGSFIHLKNGRPGYGINIQILKLKDKDRNLTALELAILQSSSRQNAPAPEERNISGVPAAHTAEKHQAWENRKGYIQHRFVVKRSRTLVQIITNLPDDATEEDTNTLMKIIETMKLDVDVDKYTGAEK
jgi:hypothetical protein